MHSLKACAEVFFLIMTLSDVTKEHDFFFFLFFFGKEPSWLTLLSGVAI